MVLGSGEAREARGREGKGREWRGNEGKRGESTEEGMRRGSHEPMRVINFDLGFCEV